MPKGPFLPSHFTATKFPTNADRAEFGNTLLRFIELLGARDRVHYSAVFFPGPWSGRTSQCSGINALPDRLVHLSRVAST